jgi:hypothetical protein
MPSEAVNETTRKEWRDLGFFYERNDDQKQWRLVGSRSGLLKFGDLLMRYAADSRNDAKSEHDHYGRYMYLTVMTWSEPGMDGESVHGTLEDLRRLADIIAAKLEKAKPSSLVRIQEEFADTCEYSLVLEVRDNGFDPASVDPELLKGAG